MTNLFAVKFAGRFGSLQLSGLMLIALLQRTPVLRVLATAESVWVSSSLGQVLKATAVVASLLGAVDTLAGATTLVTNPDSPAEATMGVPFSAVFAYTGGATSVGSYSISGLPPGLSVPSSFLLNNIRTLNDSSGTITGTPTQAGDFSVIITAFDDANRGLGSHGSAMSTYMITVLSADVAPAITTQPASLTVTAGQPASFTVVASGSPVPAFQWKKGGTNIVGATSATYTIASTVSGDAGSYTVFVSNGVGSGVTSNAATLTVNAANAAPVITTQPTSQTITAGNAVTFTAAASGTPVPTFQWKKNAVDIAGATNGSYTISGVTVGDAGSYTFVATNSVNSATSNAAVLTVNPANAAPLITTQPASQTIATGSAVSFTAAASGTPAPTFQWKKNTVAVTGATSSTYTIAAVASGDAGSYTVVATNVAGSATSNGATLTVTALPVFTTQPLSQPAFVGSNLSFTAVVSSTSALTYQWQKDGIAIPGATNATLSFVNVQLADAGSYGLVATDSVGSTTSRFARLVVLVSQSNAIVYATTVSSTSVTAGGSVNLAYFMTNVGTQAWGANHYLSIRDVNGTFVAFSSLIGTLPGEATTATLNFPAPATPGIYTYYVQALENGVQFFSNSTTVTLTVLASLPNSITYNTTTFPVGAAPGSAVVFTYNVTNTGTQTWGAAHNLVLKDSGGTTLSTALLTVLAPGASKTVNLSFTTPTNPGTYSYTVQAAQTGVGNFNTQANLTLVVLAPRPNAIVYQPIRSADAVVPGSTVSLRYKLSNAGIQTWGSGHYVSLRDSASTYLAFTSLSGIAIGGSTTVDFTLTAPTTPGVYTYYVQALENGIEFFSTQDVVILTVATLPLGNAVTYNTSTFPITATAGAAVNFTCNITNRGTRAWGATHYLSFRDVDNVFLAFPSLTGVASGASKTCNLSFTAPSTPGIYTYKVQAFEDGVAFFDMADTVVLAVQ